METKEHTRRRRTLRCSLCGLEITEGEDYWYCNGSSVCGACLPVFARAELAPFRQVRGREAPSAAADHRADAAAAGDPGAGGADGPLLRQELSQT